MNGFLTNHTFQLLYEIPPPTKLAAVTLPAAATISLPFQLATLESNTLSSGCRASQIFFFWTWLAPGGRGLLPGPRAVELEPDPVARRGARGRVERLDVLVGRVGCAEQHAVRLHAPHVPRLEVAERDDEPVRIWSMGTNLTRPETMVRGSGSPRSTVST